MARPQRRGQSGGGNSASWVSAGAKNRGVFHARRQGVERTFHDDEALNNLGRVGVVTLKERQDAVFVHTLAHPGSEIVDIHWRV